MGDHVVYPHHGAGKVMKKEMDLSGRERKLDQWQPEWIRKKYFGEGAG